MNILDNFTGTKICENCLNNAVTAYIFTNHTYFVRNRLNTVVSVMLDNLNKMEETSNNICIEVALNAIMTATEPFNDNISVNDDEIDEDKLKVDVLEDEFRLKSEDESETEIPEEQTTTSNTIKVEHTKNTALNGYLHNGFENSVCDEFLNFKKKPKPSKPKFTCTICSKHFISDYFLKRHILKHIPKKVECEICKVILPSKFSLYEHKKLVHLLNRNEFVCCEICERCFTSNQRLEYHRKRHSTKQCQLCNKWFKSQRHFDDHMLRHVNKIGLGMRKHLQNCSFCEKDCSNDNEFSLHVNKTHLQIKPYSCDMCEKQFYTEYNLRSHKELHSVNSREKCQFCKKILSSRKKLVIHIRKHIGDKPFLCPICNQTFYTQCKAKKHMKTSHGGELCCKYCKIAFENKQQLYEHVNSVHKSWV